MAAPKEWSSAPHCRFGFNEQQKCREMTINSGKAEREFSSPPKAVVFFLGTAGASLQK